PARLDLWRVQINKQAKMPMVIYELLILGSPSTQDVDGLTNALHQMVSPFGLTVGNEVALKINPDSYTPSDQVPSAALHYCSNAAESPLAKLLLKKGIPIIPVASHPSRVQADVPNSLRALN